MSLLNSKRSLVSCHNICALAPDTIKPEPVEFEAVWPWPTVIVLSTTSKSVTDTELISPVMFRSPDTDKSPPTDTPVDVSVNFVEPTLFKTKSSSYDVIVLSSKLMCLLK